MVEVNILQIRVATTFMLDPDITLLLSYLSRMGYVIASVRLSPGGVNIAPIIPPNIIAMKGGVRVDYDFGRRSLGVEGSNSREIISTLQDLWEVLKSLRIDIQKVLIPYEAIVIALASLSPKFSSNVIEAVDMIGFNLKMIEAGFALEDGDPTSPNKWLHIRIAPIYSSYKPGEKDNLCRVEVVYRDEREKILKFVENISDILKKILEKV